MRSLSIVRGMIIGAVLLLLAYVACHLLGLHETTGLLCRIDLQVEPTATEVIGLGLYLASYVGAILLAPILILAAGLIGLFDSARARVSRRG